MKKMLLIFFLFFVICLCMLSCNDVDNTETSSSTGIVNDSNNDVSSNKDASNNTDISIDAETSNDTDTSDNADINVDDTKPNVPYEKYGNKVYFTSEEKKTNYYANVTNAKEKEEPDISLDEEIEEDYEAPVIAPQEFPQDWKDYFKFIETYDELTKYISSPNIDATVFQNNYVICIQETVYLTDGWEETFKHLGYSDFELKGDKYYITSNFYFSAWQGANMDIAVDMTMVNYLIIPKTENDFVEGIYEIEVNKNQINGDNGLWTDSFLGGNKNPLPPSTNTHAYLTHNENAALPNEPTAWVVEKGSELGKQLGLEASSYSKQEYRLILYLPNEPKYDFIITEKVIKNGNLYLTVEEYPQYTNWYLNKNDVKFYDLYIKDSSELSENFDVYILVRTVKNESVERSLTGKTNGADNEAYVDGKGNEEDLNKQDILDTLVPNDEEFPFDNIVIERSGYDIVAAGKYYGNDFDNIKYYGSYYRIIDNYEDFSELTAWGKDIDESLFGDNFILVLHTYKNSYDTYYSHSKYNELNGKGRYRDFGLSESGKLMITEGKSCSAKEVVGEAPNYIEDYEVILPIETQETIYLVIPKAEMPNNTKLSGEIILYQNVIIEL